MFKRKNKSSVNLPKLTVDNKTSVLDKKRGSAYGEVNGIFNYKVVNKADE